MIPTYLEKGSKGPAVVPLLVFLLTWASLFGEEVPEGFQTDDELGERGMLLIAKYQEFEGLTVEGGCGPEMRASLLSRYNFDFELVANSVGGETIFVQPDGQQISWSPEAKG